MKYRIVLLTTLLSLTPLFLAAQEAPTAAPQQINKPPAPTAAQKEAPKLPAITAEDRANFFDADRARDKAIMVLRATPQFESAQAAESRRTQTIQAIYKKYATDPAKVALCDGPGTAPCDNVGAGELVFRPVLTEEEKK